MNSLSLPKRSGLCLIAGILAVFAMPPWNIWPAMFLGFSAFYILLAQFPAQTKLKNFLCGWLFAFGYFAAGLWWIANALLVPGNPFKWVWPLTIAGLPALLAFFPAFATLVACRRDLRTLRGFLTFTAALALFEWLRGHVFTGFPWNMFGYAWTGWPAMMQVAALGGSYFLTLLTVFWAALAGFIYVWPAPRDAKVKLASFAIVIFAASGLYGSLRLGHAETGSWNHIAVRTVQANIAQKDKWNPDKAADNLRRRLELSAPAAGETEAPLTLIVWPETALEFDVFANEQARFMIRHMLAQYKNEVYLVTGLLRYQDKRYYNSLVILDRDLNLRAVYDKSHLVPFGEYIPLQNILPMKPFVAFDGFETGGGPSAVGIPGAPAFSPLVCYEVIFPGAVTDRKGPRPQWLVNITNDAWYGDSPGPRQHFAQTRYRAIEEGLPLVRAAETGISGVIDPYGRPLYAAPMETASMDIRPLPRPLPPPLYARWGDGLFFLCIFAIALLTKLMSRHTRSL